MVMDKQSSIFVAWHAWLVGSALMRSLQQQGYTNLITADRSQLDLCDQAAVTSFFADKKPEYVFLAAAKVWWIMANKTLPADFIYYNIQLQNNVIHASYENGVRKLLFLWSSCIYPKHCPQPMKETSLLTGVLEPTNEPYAIAKIAGIKMCQSYNRQYGTDFIACMPTNLYGPYDNFDLETSHVLPAIMHKCHKAKKEWLTSITLWWDGSPMREFLYIDDMADACVFLMKNFSPDEAQNEAWEMFCNIGTWKDIAIKDLASIIKDVVWYDGEIVRDTGKPNGTPRKLQDVTRLEKMWWSAETWLREGIEKTYEWFLEHYDG